MTLEQDTSETAEVRDFQQRLLVWFDQHKRDLPWRRDRDPYRVWLSEIMLQQTRVAAVTDHYERFLRRFPSIEKLASAREATVLAAWSGLGYYRRARMLHAAAKKIVKEHGGKLPGKAEDLLALPGIGRYTASAIASIAFDEPVAVVDGNVERVLQRVHGKNLAGEDLWRAAGDLLSRQRPGDFNQAMMELGATVCLPRQPQCLLCPVSDLCATRGELQRAGEGNSPDEAGNPLRARLPEWFDFPGPAPEDCDPHARHVGVAGTAGANGTNAAWLTLRHSITVTDYVVRVLRSPAPKDLEGRWVRKSRVATLPLTGLARKILRAAKII